MPTNETGGWTFTPPIILGRGDCIMMQYTGTIQPSGVMVISDLTYTLPVGKQLEFDFAND